MDKKKLIDARVFLFLGMMIICLVLSGKSGYKSSVPGLFPQNHVYQALQQHPSLFNLPPPVRGAKIKEIQTCADIKTILRTPWSWNRSSMNPHFRFSIGVVSFLSLHLVRRLGRFFLIQYSEPLPEQDQSLSSHKCFSQSHRT